MKEIWFALVAIVALTTAEPAVAQSGAPAVPAPAKAAPSDKAAVLAVGPNDRILGNADAPITIIEYASLTCPHCAHFDADVLPKLIEKWITPGKAKLVMRDYPLDEPALHAAVIARCAPPDRFYGFVDTLFQNQREWVLAKDYQAALEHLAQLGGMSKVTFAACLANKELENQVLDSRLVATQQLAVNSTPSFFINGTRYEGEPTVEAFDAALTRAAGS